MNKLLILISTLSLFTVNTFSQTEIPKNYIPPEFKGGSEAFGAYASKYINYPQTEFEKGITGTVNTTLFINKEGKVKLVKTVGDNLSFNNETKRVLKLSDKWVPGQRNGAVIDTMINLDVYFSIGKANSKATKNDIVIVLYQETIKITDVEKLEIEEKEKAKKEETAIKLNEEGSVLLNAKKFDEALKKFNEAIKLGGNRNAFLYNRGLTYLNLKDDEKASADFLEAYRRGDLDAGKIYNDLFK